MSKTESSLTMDLRIVPSMCDDRSRMSIPAMLEVFQDVAGTHATSIGMGALDLEERGLFWIVTSVRLRINSRPLVQEMVETTTWIQPADRVKCERDWSISKDGEQIAYVRSIWAALKRKDFRPGHMADFYPDVDQPLPKPDDTPFARLRKNFDDAEILGEYRIRSVDIDRGGHMNNVQYVRALLGCFTCDQIAEMDIKEMDLQYVRQCYEGETLRIVKRPSADGIMEAAALNEAGEICFMAAVK